MRLQKVTFKEGYDLLRQAGAGRLSSAFVAIVWLLRGDEVWVDDKEE